MSTVLQIGAGGVGGVVAHKLARNKQTFSKIILASRNITKCQAIAKNIKEKQLGEIICESVDADDTEALVALIQKHQPKVVINVALPYQNLSIMEACLRTKTHYLDTANYEHPDTAKFEYKEQWAYNDRFKRAGIFGLLGSGFDPGVTNVFCAYAQKHLFDKIRTIDILDCNAGDHGYPFATNFNPEINLREVSANGRYWENGKWIETKPLEIMQTWAYPEIGEKDSYLLYHEELESLVRNIPGLQRIRFFMTFSQSYITHMKCLENVGMLGIKEVEHEGHKIIPIQFLKTLLPDPASLAGRTKGKTNIGCYIIGSKNGHDKTVYIYNVCDHQEAYRDVSAQAISYTTGVPAMIGAKLICQDIWGDMPGVWNMEQLDPDPFMEELNKQGLPWKLIEKVNV
ncbi:saccharopine dehydrogenase family protein [Helicobacter mustelae]|uniref:Putative saccharopine dehydrogenase n=1 Tax=Helicobacter mustelae (strain ATCC 43772 / CCUG 25715 / CIP 103759 / LMG 18044 / NCTC 12198 / R85-136P) TaxID=679897 RepID=D3UGV5_HELM1|nr:saccharopine dehydrogenase family protein [Helicobacter mustelae]CBG39727.1 Putative saccharopine dehydrogenase [Helicobacter mustelae 12198]SQH71233.1 saccharopine dehydrogenase [Helicobacter mustelae]STP12360.1 saccharopine dehydrogenase [Helicobacter mustelae]